MKDSLYKLSDMATIEQIGSFVPRRRQGYENNRREERIRRSSAKELYRKRLSIAENIAKSKFSARQDVITSSLVAAGISPNSVLGWSEYIDLLIEREGGWLIWKESVKRDVLIIENVREQAIKSWMYVGILSFLAIIVGNTLSHMPYYIGEVIFTLSILGCVALVASYAAPSSILMRTTSNNLLGDPSKGVSEFVKSEHI